MVSLTWKMNHGSYLYPETVEMKMREASRGETLAGGNELEIGEAEKWC